MDIEPRREKLVRAAQQRMGKRTLSSPKSTADILFGLHEIDDSDASSNELSSSDGYEPTSSSDNDDIQQNKTKKRQRKRGVKTSTLSKNLQPQLLTINNDANTSNNEVVAHQRETHDTQEGETKETPHNNNEDGNNVTEQQRRNTINDNNEDEINNSEGNATQNNNDDENETRQPLLEEHGEQRQTEGNEQAHVTEPRGRKRKKKNMKEERKNARAKGEAYITAKGKRQPQRRQRSPCNCRRKCAEKVTNDERAALFRDFWNIANRDKQKQHISDLLDTADIQRSRKRKNIDEESRQKQTVNYHVQLEGKRLQVCKKFFTGTFGLTNTYVDDAIKKRRCSVSGILKNDQRGKHEPHNKGTPEDIKRVHDHISLFPSYVSHYSRSHTDSKYLPSNLNLAIMYDKYKDHCVQNELTARSRSFYANIFYKEFNLRFKQPHNDICTQCSELQAKIKYAVGDEKISFKKQLDDHQARADDGYTKKRLDKVKMQNNKELQVATMDLQQCLPTPLLADDDVFYKRLLWTYNLTVHESGTEQSINFMWPECSGGRGSNQIASCIYRYVREVRTDKSNFIFYSDTCGGQNRNINVASMFTHLVHTTPHVDSVDQKFLEPGHTHLEADGDHGQIEKAKKVSTFAVETPRDWMQLVRTVRVKKRPPFKAYEMQTGHFKEFSNLLKTDLVHRRVGEDKQAVNWLKVKWLRYTKEYGTVLYKHTLDEEKPFKKLQIKRTQRGRPSLTTDVPLRYEGPVPINPLKKRDILTLLPRLDPMNRPFYEGLTTSDDVALVDPDIHEGYNPSEIGESAL